MKIKHQQQANEGKSNETVSKFQRNVCHLTMWCVCERVVRCFYIISVCVEVRVVSKLLLVVDCHCFLVFGNKLLKSQGNQWTKDTENTTHSRTLTVLHVSMTMASIDAIHYTIIEMLCSDGCPMSLRLTWNHFWLSSHRIRSDHALVSLPVMPYIFESCIVSN